MQRGPLVRKYEAQDPTHSRNLRNVFDLGTGRKVCTDAEGTIAKGNHGPEVPAPKQRLQEL